MNDRTLGTAAETGEGGPPGAKANGPAVRPDVDRTGRDLDDLIAEARALALYVSRHGDALSDDKDKLHENLLVAIRTVIDEPSTKGWQDLMAAYAKVTAVTYKERGVNGRTILDTNLAPNTSFWRSGSPKDRPIRIGVLFFVLALLLELLMNWSGGVSDATTLGWIVSLGYLIGTTLSDILSPALWGGLGACIFLTKRISDKLFELAYEESRMRGDVTRIFLGSMLGVVAVALMFPDFTERVVLGEASLGPATVAFVAGLGVKPVYAAFELLSEELARRFSGKRQADQG